MGGGGGGGAKTHKKWNYYSLSSINEDDFFCFIPQSLVARHFRLSQSSWAFKIKDGDYSNGPFSRLSTGIYSFPGWLCHLRTFHTCLARNSPVTSIQLTNLPIGRWLRDLMHWNSVSSLLRTYESSSCSKSSHFRSLTFKTRLSANPFLTFISIRMKNHFHTMASLLASL